MAHDQYKNLIKCLGFLPKENASGKFQKKYAGCKEYRIEIDFENEKINYGDLIQSESSTTLNFSQSENWVVLECVDRLLTKGYQPENIILEKTWATGHGTSGRLDILVTRDDGVAYLMIECKTWGNEFEKALKKIEKDGGQLFTYFQQDKNADVLMLYTSVFDKGEVNYKNVIVKIEEDYRQTGNVKDFFERWNKLPKTNGIFDGWVTPYEYQSKALTKKDLRVLKQEDSSFIFNRFLEILRHNVVSDKPNAFNKIFTLFLCKIVDENRNDDEQLNFQWIEGEDDHISFQKRLTDLYRRGMKELLEKQVTDVSDSEFDNRFQQIEDKYREEIKIILTEIRLKKNNEFAFKEVYDDDSFNDNAKVVKEIVELLQVYQLRYTYRQQFLSDFFELLLTTGLKQESGQFFTPVPIARFILRSIPICEITEQKLQAGNRNDLLPLIIDYAAGSGHFVTEAMEDIQKYIDKRDENNYTPATKRALKKWKDDQFDWAEDYIYAIEKDYRLVKTAKVSCYLHGDGLAKVIHGDGLGDFSTSKEFKDLLKITDRVYPQDNKQFDIVVSNPPYSVSAFKGTMAEEDISQKAFDLYSRLTDQSSEIECLFIERTKQLLKDGGIAGVILPSSILSNSGIYTQSREIIFKYFEVVAIAELGNNTFMATGTNTVILFLRRRNNADCENIHAAVDRFAVNFQDVTINGFEKPVQKYIAHVWEGINFEDYVSLIQKQPSESIQQHELFKEYNKKIKARNEQEKADNIVALELEKLFYFILAYPQKIVLVKSGEKNAEKRFLGYEFSYRRGSEGIHPIQRSKTIDKCTSLYDAHSFDNPEKASTYIYKSFKGENEFKIPESLKKNVFQAGLVDMMTFDRVDFEKNISLYFKKRIRYEAIWGTAGLVGLSDVAVIQKGTSITENKVVPGDIPVVAGGKESAYFHNISNREANIITVSASGANSGFVNYFDQPIFASDCNTIKSKDERIITTRLIFHCLKAIQEQIYFLQRGQAQPHVYAEDLAAIKIPLSSKEIQGKIITEIEVVEKKEEEAKRAIDDNKRKIQKLINTSFSQYNHKLLSELCDSVEYGTSAKSEKEGKVPVVRMGNIQNGKINWDDLVYTNDEKEISKYSLNYNDVLFNRTNSPELVGKVGIYKGEQPAVFAGYLIRINYKADLIHPTFLTYVLNSETIRDYGFSVMSKSVNQANINGTLLKSYRIPCPPLSEQQKIVQQIEQLENQISELQKQLEQIPKQKEMILKKYLE